MHLRSRARGHQGGMRLKALHYVHQPVDPSNGSEHQNLPFEIIKFNWTLNNVDLNNVDLALAI